MLASMAIFTFSRIVQAEPTGGTKSDSVRVSACVVPAACGLSKEDQGQISFAA